ncbi:MAG: CRISPR-associated protein, partial [Bacteroidota bacterium]
DLGSLLYRNNASTAINEKGIAQAKSLRVMQVTMPVTLVGYISSIEQTHCPMMEQAFKWVRHLGVGRNRGLGRCRFSKI